MKISINLLPPEIIAQEIKKTKFYKIQAIGVSIVMAMVFLTSLTMALRILQSGNIVRIETILAQEEQKVTSLKSTQASLFILKDRLSVIDKYLGIPTKQNAMYQLLNKIIPAPVVISAVNINKSGEVIVSALAPDSQSLDTLISNLTTKEINEDKISQVSIESLNKGRDNYYRISLKIKPKP